MFVSVLQFAFFALKFVGIFGLDLKYNETIKDACPDGWLDESFLDLGKIKLIVIDH